MSYVSALYVYPIKSLPGISVQNAAFTRQGFADDRIFMLVDQNGRMVTLREHPALATFTVRPVPDGYLVGRRSQFMMIPSRELDPQMHERVLVEIHGKPSTMLRLGDEYDLFFSRELGMPLRLVRSSRAFVRTRIGSGMELSLYAQDGYPAMIISEASFAFLNKKIIRAGREPIMMEQLRPNIVIGGNCEPHEEDMLAPVSFDRKVFGRVKLCSRCPAVMARTAPLHESFGRFDPTKEPLKTLKTYRRVHSGNGDPAIYFGVNAVPESYGELAAGMPVKW